jgi:hypothetical protein
MIWFSRMTRWTLSIKIRAPSHCCQRKRLGERRPSVRRQKQVAPVGERTGAVGCGVWAIPGGRRSSSPAIQIQGSRQRQLS